ncbi:MAG: thioester reductase domain-containing protein [Polyangiales bacterium]
MSGRPRRDAARRQLLRLAAPDDLSAALPGNGAPVVPPGAPRVDAGSRVLLTGATGFLGAHLLADLLETARGDGEVLCLLRCADPRDGARRVREALQRHRRWRDDHAGRIVVVPGDLGRERLGLDDAAWSGLAREVDVIVHNGAAVNLLLPWAVLEPANVGATRALLTLAATGRPKALHYVSTATVHFGRGGVVGEDDPLSAPPRTLGGYVQTKWVAEQWVRAARARGLAAAIHRPAIVGWAAETGIPNLPGRGDARGDAPRVAPAARAAPQGGDFLCGMLAAALKTGVAPELDLAFNVVPVDRVSRSLVAAARDPRGTGRDYHLVHARGTTWGELLTLCGALGHPIERVPYDAWHRGVDGAPGPYAPYLMLLPEADGEGHASSLAGLLAPERTPTLSRANAEALCRRAGVTYPDVDAALLGRCVPHLLDGD